MTTVNLGVKQVEIKTDLPNLLGVVSPNRTFAVCFDKIQVISLGCDLETAGACLARRQRQLTRLARTEALPDPSRAALHRRSCSVRLWGGKTGGASEKGSYFKRAFVPPMLRPTPS